MKKARLLNALPSILAKLGTGNCAQRMEYWFIRALTNWMFRCFYFNTPDALIAQADRGG
jgi:hypothetical protein